MDSGIELTLLKGGDCGLENYFEKSKLGEKERGMLGWIFQCQFGTNWCFHQCTSEAIGVEELEKFSRAGFRD